MKPDFYIQPYKNRKGMWRFRVRHRNGKIMGHEYNTKAAMEKSVNGIVDKMRKGCKVEVVER